MLEKLVATSAQVAETRSRKDKIARLAGLLRELPAEQVGIGASYLAGELPQGKIGIGWSVISRVLEETAPAASASLTLADVDATLTEIASARGGGSTQTRRDRLGALLSRATTNERSFLTRLLGGELRQGALAGILVDAIARASDIPAADVRRALMFVSDIGKVAEVARREGKAGLARFNLVLFQPVLPMLASPAEDVEDALTQLGRASFELKLDGARVQIHKQGDEVRIYSRLLNEVTERLPEIVSAVRACLAPSLVIDGEVLALHPDGSPQPFQMTMRRFGRKLDVGAIQAELPLSLYAFDCLHRDGHSLLDSPQEARMAALKESLPAGTVVPHIITDDPERAEEEFRRALDRGHEGLLAKALDAPYAAGRRGGQWLKLKAAHTLDLVVLGVEWGSGRRQGTLSNLHLGARHGDDFVMLGKTFKGLSDAMLAWQTERLLALELRREGHIVFVRPELVVEIAFNDVQESPHYPGGLALRFARVKRHRPDKRAADADTLDTVRAIHQRGHKKS